MKKSISKENKAKDKTENMRPKHPRELDIPTIGYRGAALISLSIFLSSFFYPFILKKFFKNYVTISYILGSLTIGFSLAYTHCFLGFKKRSMSVFYLVGIIMSIITMLILIII